MSVQLRENAPDAAAAGGAKAEPGTLEAAMEQSSADRAARTIEVVITTSARDRQGDVIETPGLDFTQFLRNPVVLWAHDQERPPVGRVLGVARSGETVRARVEFARTPFAEEVFSLYCGGFLRAWSIGFLPVRWRRLPASQGGGRHIEAAEVVELSAVPVPANPEALTKALGSYPLLAREFGTAVPAAAAGRSPCKKPAEAQHGFLPLTKALLERLVERLALRRTLPQG